MVAVIAHTNGAPNHRSAAVSGPPVAPDAVGFRSLGPHAGNLGALRRRQARRRAAVCSAARPPRPPGRAAATGSPLPG
jgi:hypothetical protein